MSTVLINDEYLTDIADAIRTKNNTTTTYRPKDMATAITALSIGSSNTSTSTATTSEGVAFIDHDGTELYSYTWDEISELTTLPDLPTWTAGTEYGLEIPMTCTGWNWSLENIQNYATYGGLLTVGAVYEPTDGKTHLVIHVGADFEMYLYVYNQDTTSVVTVDWGDGASDESGAGVTDDLSFTHTYSAGAYYDITIDGDDYAIGSSSGGLSTNTSASYKHTEYSLSAQQITAVFIGTNCESITDRNFMYCSNLATVTIPDGVTSIGTYAFCDCEVLTLLIIPDSVTSIGNYAFRYCYNLATVTIPGSVTSIGNYAFYDCYALAALAIPDSVTSIGTYAFDYCYCLTSLTIPGDIASISNYAFANCYSLTSLTILGGVTSIGDYAFQNCYGLTSFTIPESVTSIGSNTFYNCRSLTSLTIPDGVTSIGSYAFYNCASFTSVIIPDGVTSISSNTFTNCSGLTSLTIPESVTSIGNNAFYNCYSLASLTIPDGVTSIGTHVFYRNGLTELDGLYIASAATGMFTDVYNLVNLTNVRYIGKDIDFSDCEKLTVDSLNNIIAALCDDGEDLTLTIGDTNLAKLTDDEIAVATDKGWTVV